MRLRSFLMVGVISLGLYGCSHHGAIQPAVAVAPMLTGDPAHPGQTSGWVDTQLYFGLGPADAPDKGISETKWREFLDREVSTRFPDGLSVVDVYGQWQGVKQKTPERLRSKLLIIDYPNSQENRDKVEAIRSAWKKQTGDQSVMRVTQPADVSF